MLGHARARGRRHAGSGKRAAGWAQMDGACAPDNGDASLRDGGRRALRRGGLAARRRLGGRLLGRGVLAALLDKKLEGGVSDPQGGSRVPARGQACLQLRHKLLDVHRSRRLTWWKHLHESGGAAQHGAADADCECGSPHRLGQRHAARSSSSRAALFSDLFVRTGCGVQRASQPGRRDRGGKPRAGCFRSQRHLPFGETGGSTELKACGRIVRMGAREPCGASTAPMTRVCGSKNSAVAGTW